MNVILAMLAICCCLSAIFLFLMHFTNFFEFFYHLFISKENWSSKIFLIRASWFFLTIFLAECVNDFPALQNIELNNQLTVVSYISVYSTTLIFSFLADIKYWKPVITKLPYDGENRHKALRVDTFTTFCTTVLFAYLLTIQSSTQSVLIEYSPTNGSAISWKLNMIVAWLMCSFLSIKLILDHARKIRFNEMNKVGKDPRHYKINPQIPTYGIMKPRASRKKRIRKK